MSYILTSFFSKNVKFSHGQFCHHWLYRCSWWSFRLFLFFACLFVFKQSKTKQHFKENSWAYTFAKDTDVWMQENPGLYSEHVTTVAMSRSQRSFLQPWQHCTKCGCGLWVWWVAPTLRVFHTFPSSDFAWYVRSEFINWRALLFDRNLLHAESRPL